MTEPSAPVAAAPSLRRPALPQLTGLRALAAAWVVLFHYRTDLEALAPWLAPLDGLMRSGYLGVDLFFPLSGFVLAYNYADALRGWSWRGAREFVQNRVARVWPVHLVTLHIDLLTAFLVGTLGVGEDGHRRTPTAYVQNIFMVHYWFNDRPSFNRPAWSISAEWFAYLLSPLIFLLVARLWRARAAVVLAVVAYAAMLGTYAAFDLPNGNLENMFYVRILGEFVAGVAFAVLWMRGGLDLGRMGTPVLVVAFAAPAVLPLVAGGHYWFAPVLGLVVATLASSRGWAARWLSRPRMVAAGEASYCLYMTHYLLQPVVGWLGGWGDETGWQAAVAFLAILAALGAAAWAMHLLVEVPARRALRARPPRVAVP